MQNNHLPDGLWPVMLTPFQDNYEVDYKALEGLTEFYIQSGAAGLFSNCLSSEMFQLTDAERLKITSTVVKKAEASKLKVVASGTFSYDVSKCADFISKVYDAGASAVIIITNQLARYEDDESTLKNNLEKLMTLTGNIPLGTYECPYPYKRLISESMMKWLAQTGRFFYHKDTSCDPISIERKIEAISGTMLSFFNANTATALSSLEKGANGLSAIVANIFPEFYSYMFNEFRRNGTSPHLQQLNSQLDMVDSVISHGYPYSAKFFLQSEKMDIKSVCRIQNQNLLAEDYIKLKSLEQIHLSMKKEYGIQ